MSTQNSSEKPVFEVSKKMYQELLDWQQKQEKTSPENSTDQKADPTKLEPQKINRQDDN